MITKPSIYRTVLFMILMVMLIGSFDAQPVSAEADELNVYIFEGEGCPYCARAVAFFHDLAEKDERIVLHDFEVYHSLENREYYTLMAAEHGFEPMYVPAIFIGEYYWVGFSETIQAEIEAVIQECQNSICVDVGKQVLPASMVNSDGLPVETKPGIEVDPSGVEVVSNVEGIQFVLPLFGTINLADRSLLLSTILISFVDGFNPCSIWVLSMLLAITLNTRSRKKVLIIGFVFIFVTALIYALFVGGLFTVFTFIGYIGWIQLVVALIAFIFALVNIKDYFWYKEGLSFTISDKQKPGIYQGIRRIMNAEENLWGLVSATVLLAAGVSLVEFSCTAGFPMIWTNLLAAQDVSGLAFVGFLMVYMLVYQLDEMGIFLAAVFTLRKSKMEEKYGRILKLLGGVLMLSLSVVMLVEPTLMNNIRHSMWVFGFAFGVTGVVLLVHRVLIPRFYHHAG